MVHSPRIFLLFAVLMVCIPHDHLPAQDISHPIQIPAGFHHGLIYVEPVSKDGDTLRFFTDTADATILYQQSVDRHSLVTTNAIIQGRQQLAAFLPPFDSTRFIPPPLISDGLIPVRDDDRMPPHHRVILGSDIDIGSSGSIRSDGGNRSGDGNKADGSNRPDDGTRPDGSTRTGDGNGTGDDNGTDGSETDGSISPDDGNRTGGSIRPGDGILGSIWFASRAWSINYRDETFYAVPVSSLEDKGFFTTEPNGDEDGRRDRRTGSDGYSHHPTAAGSLPDNVVPLYFRMEGNRRTYHYPGMHVAIAGDTLSMVLKTGSNIILNDPAQTALGHPDALFPAGLISESVAAGWMEEHPDWPVYEGADHNYGSDVIEVPEVRIGPHAGGPVRFAIRRDDAFTEWFSQFTGLPVVGALGPDAFRDAHITINYPGSVLIFHDY